MLSIVWIVSLFNRLFWSTCEMCAGCDDQTEVGLCLSPHTDPPSSSVTAAASKPSVELGCGCRSPGGRARWCWRGTWSSSGPSWASSWCSAPTTTSAGSSGEGRRRGVWTVCLKPPSIILVLLLLFLFIWWPLIHRPATNQCNTKLLILFNQSAPSLSCSLHDCYTCASCPDQTVLSLSPSST